MPNATDRALAKLDDREREIMRLRLGLDRTPPAPRTLEQLASSFGLTWDRMKQIESRALSKLSDEDRKALASSSDANDPGLHLVEPWSEDA
jgi:DNA-directed RNA polymerase sigma subunit (sigma70/sigma32)